MSLFVVGPCLIGRAGRPARAGRSHPSRAPEAVAAAIAAKRPDERNQRRVLPPPQPRRHHARVPAFPTKHPRPPSQAPVPHVSFGLARLLRFGRPNVLIPTRPPLLPCQVSSRRQSQSHIGTNKRVNHLSRAGSVAKVGYTSAHRGRQFLGPATSI